MLFPLAKKLFTVFKPVAFTAASAELNTNRFEAFFQKPDLTNVLYQELESKFGFLFYEFSNYLTS